MQETQLQQKEILAEKKENISKKSMHKKIILISFISILGIFFLIVGFYVGSKYSLRDSSDPVKLSFQNMYCPTDTARKSFCCICDKQVPLRLP